jgi:uncharacterized protein with PIN domain/tRNA(Ser,Leu) C12 N-acetylase TAN1
MLFLIRYAEIGKEPRPEKSKLRRDIVEALRSAIDEPQITIDVGRIILETPRDVTDVLARIHGIASFSPCLRCGLDELTETVVAFAQRVLAGKRSFAIKVKRAGSPAPRSSRSLTSKATSNVTSKAKAAELGSAVLDALPGVTVNLTDPDETIHVEVRGETCYLFNRIHPGIDVPRPGRAPGAPVSARRFLIDAMLGTLATRMRILGYDAVCHHDTADSFLLRKSAEEGRTLLTQDKELARLGGESAYLVLGKTLDEQLTEVFGKFGLEVSESALFTRCSVCNAELERTPKERVAGLVPERVFGCYDEFFACPACAKIYWKGSHYDQIVEAIPKGVRRA